MAGVARFFTPGPAGGEYTFNRDDETRGDVREWCEALWDRFRPFCPDEIHFLNDARANFHARTWEMTLACWFLDRGFALEKPTTDAPDLKIVGGPVARFPVWVEATIATLGQDGHPDHAGRIERPFTIPDGKEHLGKFAMLTLKPEKTALRYTNAIWAKVQQLEDFRARKIVAPEDVFLVAVNGGMLDDYSSGDADPEILKSVYPIGEAVLHYTVGGDEDAPPPRWEHNYRGHVAKANGATVTTTGFVTPEYAGVSGLLFSKATAWNPNPKAPDYMMTIHNARAANPLPDGFFRFGREAVVSDGQIRWVQHSDVGRGTIPIIR